MGRKESNQTNKNCVSGWVKTFEDYYRQQTKHVFDLMVQKLEQYPKGKFMYAEISFFSKWWNEIDAATRDKMKRFVWFLKKIMPKIHWPFVMRKL